MCSAYSVTNELPDTKGVGIKLFTRDISSCVEGFCLFVLVHLKFEMFSFMVFKITNMKITEVGKNNCRCTKFLPQ